MPLRSKKTSTRSSKWTPENLKLGFEEFFKEYGHYPTASEIDTYEYLPNTRFIQRKLGGLIQLRKSLGINGQDDYRTGAHSKERSLKISARAHETEQVVYEYLSQRFSKEMVHREYLFNDDARTRVDFFIYDGNGNFCVDVFYPDNYKNLIGCLNSKQQKYIVTPYPTIFLQMNTEILQTEIDHLVSRKKNPLLRNQHVMGWEAFERFCNARDPR